MTYLDGKRCWANPGHLRAWRKPSISSRRIVVKSRLGDSNDAAGDATVVSLVINRSQDDLMCRAYDSLFAGA